MSRFQGRHNVRTFTNSDDDDDKLSFFKGRNSRLGYSASVSASGSVGDDSVDISDDAFSDNSSDSSDGERKTKKRKTVSIADLDSSTMDKLVSESAKSDSEKSRETTALSDGSDTQEIKLVQTVDDTQLSFSDMDPESPVKKNAFGDTRIKIDDNEDQEDLLGDLAVRQQKSINQARERVERSMKIKAMQKLEKEYTEKYKLPPILKLDDLQDKCQPFLHTAMDLLDGKIPSGFYMAAKAIFKNSNSAILSTRQLRQLDLSQFSAGFYGLMRQYVVSEMIVKEYEKKLKANRSPVLKWWGIEDFSTYVLAPEVLISLCISEMGMKPGKGEDMEEVRERAYELFENTREFGSKVADEHCD